MNRLTRQEQLVLCVFLGLLLTGWAVRAYRLAYPPVQNTEPVRQSANRVCTGAERVLLAGFEL